MQIIQLSEIGEIDPEITFEFPALWELDEAGRAAVQKMEADTAVVLMDAGVIAPEEERTRQAGDPESLYHGLKGAPPEPPDPDEFGDPDKSDVAEKIEKEGAEGGETGSNSGT